MRGLLATTASLGLLAACGGDGSPPTDVLAASSFTDVAEPLEALIESELGIDVRFSFGSSGSFYEQLNQGAPASVVLTANAMTMSDIEQAGLVATSVAISTNQLSIVTANTDAGRAVNNLADLESAGTVVVLCAASAPCGAATDAMLTKAGVSISPSSREPNVRATLTKVLLGEADAAIVYRTDVVATPAIRAVDLDESVNVSVTGRAAAVPGDDDAATIVALLAGPEARAVLHAAGFDAP